MRILITGVNRGLGHHMAREALVRGWQVAGTLRQGCAPKGVTAHPLDMQALPAGLDRLAADLGPIDCLILNAGIIGPAQQNPLEVSAGALRELLDINAIAPLMLAQALLGNLRAGQQPRILAISSQMAWMGYRKADHIGYRASKAALNKLMQGLATTLEPEGIPVALIDPGWLRTDMGGPEADRDPREAAAEIITTAAGLDLARTGQFLTTTGQPRAF